MQFFKFLMIPAPYEFLHDISCRMRVPIKSPFRQSLIARFWRSLKSFAQSDLLLSHLESFMNSVSSYYLPEVLKNGMPLYYLTPGSCQPTVGSRYKFTWKFICYSSRWNLKNFILFFQWYRIFSVRYNLATRVLIEQQLVAEMVSRRSCGYHLQARRATESVSSKFTSFKCSLHRRSVQTSREYFV